MVLSTRPEWTRATTGIPIDCVARIKASPAGTRQDIQASRSRISLLRPGSLQSKPEDEYDVGYVYAAEANNKDITARSITPLLRKFVEGYNVTAVVFGATGAGKTFTLEGPRAKDSGRVTSEGEGVVHHAIDELFRILNQKAVAVGDMIAQKRRMPAAKAFDFFLESSYVELYNEGCHDLYQQGAAVQAALPVYEDEMEGYQVSGLTYRLAKSEAELRAAFNQGRAQRDGSMNDLGSVHERAAAIFTLHLAQYAPAAVPGEEDRVLVSRFQFVDMPGAERLAMDPELLRLREGPQLNKGLLAFQHCIRSCAEAGAATEFANHEASVLTRLLADALGGNALVLMIGCIRQGDWEISKTTCESLAVAQTARNYPIINHGRARGYLLRLRRRLLAVLADRETLRDQLAEVPADGDPNAVAISIARVRDLEARLLAEREEKGRLMDEKQALGARLAKLRDAGTDELTEKAELQEALIKSEELRLGLAKTLIDTQMEYNDQEVAWENEKHDLLKRLAEAEAGHLERYVRSEEYAALQQHAESINSQLLTAQDALGRKEAHIEELQKEYEELKAKLRSAESELNQIGGAEWSDEQIMGDFDPDSVEGKRRKLFITLRQKERRIQELTAEVKDLHKEVDRLRNARTLTQTGLDEIREAYRRKLETLMRDVQDLGRAVAIMQDDPVTGVAVKPEDLFTVFQKLTDENLRVTEGRERELRVDLDSLQGRHVELKRKFRSLYLAYRQIRYLIEDSWPTGTSTPPLQVPTEEEVLGAAVEGIVKSEEDADRRLIARLRDQASQLGTQLAALRIADAAASKGIPMKPSNLALGVRDNMFENDKYVELPDMVRLENEKLREELDKIRAQVAGTPVDRLRKDNQVLNNQLAILSKDPSKSALAKQLAAAKLEVDNLKQQLAGGGGGGVANGKGPAPGASTITQQVKEYSNKAVAELERKLTAAEAAKLMAEEQLSSLQAYLTKATMQYQREIVRLRAVLGQVDPSGQLLRTNPIRGK